MKTVDKSLELATLMRWKLKLWDGFQPTVPELCGALLEPYATTHEGLAQFAAILLKFPEVMIDYQKLWLIDGIKPTQENILDEILRMNGVEL